MRFKNYTTLLQAIGMKMDGIGMCPQNARIYINGLLAKFSDDCVEVIEEGENTEFELVED